MLPGKIRRRPSLGRLQYSCAIQRCGPTWMRVMLQILMPGLWFIGDAAGMMRGVKTSRHGFTLVQTTNVGLECSPFSEVALVNNEGPDNYAGLKPHYDRINPVIKKLKKEGLNVDGSRVNVDFFQGGDLPFQAAVNGRCGHSGESFCDLCLDKLVDIQDLGRHEDGSCFMKP
jgi:hypothetical protein